MKRNKILLFMLIFLYGCATTNQKISQINIGMSGVGDHENGPKTNQGGAVENVAMSRDLLKENMVFS